MDNIDWARVGTGALKAASAAVVLAIGITAVVVTGGAALPAVMGIFVIHILPEIKTCTMA